MTDELPSGDYRLVVDATRHPVRNDEVLVFDCSYSAEDSLPQECTGDRIPPYRRVHMSQGTIRMELGEKNGGDPGPGSIMVELSSQGESLGRAEFPDITYDRYWPNGMECDGDGDMSATLEVSFVE